MKQSHKFAAGVIASLGLGIAVATAYAIHRDHLGLVEARGVVGAGGMAGVVVHVDARELREDALGGVLRAPEDTDAWHDYLLQHGVKMLAAPRSHRDGARSFYCQDPDGNLVQLIYHPPLAG